MSKPILTSLILFAVLACKIANAQIYEVKALDGPAQKIRVVDNEKSTLVISSLKDTIRIYNWNNTIATALLNRTFLKVVYNIQGGVGIQEAHTIILCVNKNKLIEALHFESLFHEEFIDFRKPLDTTDRVSVYSTYRVSLSITGNNAKNYKLNARIHDTQKSKLSKKDNFNRNSIAHLNFDPVENVFYTSQLEVSRYFTVSGPKFRKKAKQHIKGKLPVAKFGKMTYYYVKDCWYERGDDELVKYSYR